MQERKLTYIFFFQLRVNLNKESGPRSLPTTTHGLQELNNARSLSRPTSRSRPYPVAENSVGDTSQEESVSVQMKKRRNVAKKKASSGESSRRQSELSSSANPQLTTEEKENIVRQFVKQVS